ncbi:heme ABC exporter ATP-binding protein CcmA [Bartonella sp. DGB2]|uniref:heme ABC exporter ATP-binding protein CcmA n=1 Tax=Bartonella sp. DGB2 TaxID=3388426 RepID=UPI00398FA11A
MHITVQNLAGQAGDELIFHQLSFDLKPQKCLQVTGANGVGKSTLLRIIAGLRPPACGYIHATKEGETHPLASICHYISVENTMKGSLNTLENLRFWARFLEVPAANAQNILNAMDLAPLADLPFRALSTGQKRRLGLARLLLAYRPLWILDEPTSGLDTKATTFFGTILKAHLSQGGMALIASHIALPFTPHDYINLHGFAPHAAEEGDGDASDFLA